MIFVRAFKGTYKRRGLHLKGLITRLEKAIAVLLEIRLPFTDLFIKLQNFIKNGIHFNIFEGELTSRRVYNRYFLLTGRWGYN